MGKYIDAERLKAEIERRLKDYWNICFHDTKTYNEDSNVRELKDLLSFLSTLESEKPMQEELDKEIGKIWETCEPVDEGMGVETANIHIEQFDYLARHFAQWGAEHLADARKTSPNDLEEAAQESATQYYIDAGYSPFPNVETAAHKSGFIAGAKWDREQMMKETVEARIGRNFTGVQEISFTVYPDKYKVGDKVKIIIVKEDEK